LPDNILMDIDLPKLDGWSILEALSAEPATQSIPKIVVSVDDRKRISLQKGASEHLVKPAKGEELEAILQLYAARRSGTILLVEDDEATGRLYEQGLRQAGFDVTRAAGASQAETVLAQQSFALVITDLKMPEGDGFSLLRFLSNLPEETRPPVLVMTGQPLNAIERKILQNRSQGILLKSGLSPRHLVSSVNEVLDAA
jgi:CheY-like chemotaxis protein